MADMEIPRITQAEATQTKKLVKNLETLNNSMTFLGEAILGLGGRTPGKLEPQRKYEKMSQAAQSRLRDKTGKFLPKEIKEQAKSAKITQEKLTGLSKSVKDLDKTTKDKEKSEYAMQELWRTIIHTTKHEGEGNNGAYLSRLLEDLEQGTQCEITSENTEREEIQISERQRQSFMERRSNLQEKEGHLRECKVCSLPTGIYINGKGRWICYGTSIGDGKISWSVIDENGVCSSYLTRIVGQQDRKPDVICQQCGTQILRTFEGSYGGFQPKPAVEVIIVAMKPLAEKTFVDQSLKNGKGISWLDDCRIPYDGEPPQGSGNVTKNSYSDIMTRSLGKDTPNITPQSGRFPANLLVSDDVLNDGMEQKAGDLTGQRGTVGNVYGVYNRDKKLYLQGNNVSSFSRYFDLDKWAQKTMPFLIVPKASKSEKNKGCDGLEKKEASQKYNLDSMVGNARKPRKCTGLEMVRNNHPTVKPLKLMSYLITLGSRTGDIVFDPFSGSGTTMLASKLMNRKCIGIEIEEKYCEIAVKRCSQSVMDLSR